MAVLLKLQAILREYTGDRSMTITAETVIAADIGLDSYDLAQLVGLIEETFNIEVSARAAMQMQTAGDVAAYIERMIK